MKHKLFLNILVILTIVTSKACFAEDAKNSFVAVVDVEKVVLESLAGKDLTKKLEARVEKFQKKFSEKESSLQKERDTIEKKQSVLAKDVLDKMVKDFQTKALDVQKSAQNERMEIEKAKSSALEEIDAVAKEITRDIAIERGIKVVSPMSTLLYFDPKTDITDEIMTKLDKKITKINFEVKGG